VKEDHYRRRDICKGLYLRLTNEELIEEKWLNYCSKIYGKLHANWEMDGRMG
jgi:hypothetical protein